MTLDEAAKEIESLRKQLAECQAECEEQARLNGAGSSREAALMARLAECQQKLEMAEAVIAGDGALITGLKNDLAECQAREKVLRDALEHAEELSPTISQQTDDALSIPSDSTALDNMLRHAKREALLEAAGRLDPDDAVSRTFAAWLRRRAEELK
jgi:chromosome segregation ATPase